MGASQSGGTRLINSQTSTELTLLRLPHRKHKQTPQEGSLGLREEPGPPSSLGRLHDSGSTSRDSTNHQRVNHAEHVQQTRSDFASTPEVWGNSEACAFAKTGQSCRRQLCALSGEFLVPPLPPNSRPPCVHCPSQPPPLVASDPEASAPH